MKTLTLQLDDYLKFRRDLGYKLNFVERVLKKFTGFADERNQFILTTQLFLDWRKNYESASNETWSNRLGMVRSFARFLAGINPAHEIPQSGLFPHRSVKKRLTYILRLKL